jgi:hypothetical protein
MADTEDVGVFHLRGRLASRGPAISLRRLLDDDREPDLAGVLVVYDRSLALLDALHQSGSVHRAVTADVVGIGANGAVTLDEPTAAPRGEDQPLVFELQGPAAMGAAATRDVRALTLVMVEALTHGSAGAPIPLAARELMRRGLGEDTGVPAPAGELRADTDEAGRAFFGEGWRDAGVAALAQAVSQLVRETPSGGGPRRRARRGLAGVAIGAGLLLAAPILVGRALASDPTLNGPLRQAGVSSVIVTAPAATLVSPAPADTRGGSQLIPVPSASPSPGSSSTRRRAAATANTAVTPRRGATSELTPSPLASASATATPGPTAGGTPSAAPSPTPSATATPSPSPTPTPKPTASPTPTPTPKATSSPTAKPTAKPTPTATPKPTP